MNQRFGVFVLAAAVVDTEAKIKNLTSFRDNLRAMLKKPSATVKDLVESINNYGKPRRSWTAGPRNESEKITVDISFRAETRSPSAGGLRPIANALRESGSILKTAWLRSFTQFSYPCLARLHCARLLVSGQDLAAGPPPTARLVPSSLSRRLSAIP